MGSIVITTAQKAIAELRKDLKWLMRALALPAAVIVIADLAQREIVEFKYLLGTVFYIANFVFAVTIHRHILLGKNYLLPHWKTYASYAVGVGSLLFVTACIAYPMTLFDDRGSKPFILIVFLAFPIIYAASRISLLLPILAVQKWVPIKTIWNYSRGNGWRLVAVLTIPTVALQVLTFPILWLSGDEVGRLLKAVFGLPISAVEVAILTCAYRDLSSRYHEA